MNGSVFVDTSVLVRLFDDDEPDRQAAARAVIGVVPGEDAGPVGLTYHTLPGTQLRIELVDVARKPALERWFAGGEFPSALAESDV